MPTLTYRGDYGSSVTLANTRTTTLTCDETPPSTPILVQSARARIYVSTTARPYTYKYHVAIDGGYTGDLDYNFASVDDPVYVDVPIDVTALDEDFPCKTISTISVSETGGHGSNTRIRGLVRVYVEYVNVISPNPPTNLRINGETAINLEADKTATLTWSAATIGQYDRFISYHVWRYDVAAGAYESLGLTGQLTYTITAPYTDSKSYYYYVDVLTANYNRRSSTYASIYTYIQLTAPTFYGGGDHPVYNPRPMLLVELGIGPQDEYLTLVANGWTPSRRGFPGDHIYLKRNAAYQDDTMDSVSVTETDERMRSITATVAVDYAAPVYTNPQIIAGETIVRAVDITELQECLANLRESYGMTDFAFTPCVAGVTSLNLWTTHIAELQTCIRQIQSFINSWDLTSVSYAVILPRMITSNGPSAAVITQLRQIITML